MRSQRRLKNLLARNRRALVVVPTMVGYVIMALGIPISVRAAKDAGRPHPVAARVCCCGSCDHAKKKCCCCRPAAKDTQDQPDPVAVPPTSALPPLSQEAGNSAVTWQVYWTAPSCDEEAKLWLTDNPASVPPPLWTWRVAQVSVGWLQPIDCSTSALTMSPPAPPPRA